MENTNRHLRQKLQIECGWKHGDNGARSNGQEAIQRRSGDGTSEASLPSPPSTSCCDAATRQGSPYGSLGLGLDGARPRRGEILCWEEGMAGTALAVLCQTRLPLVGNEENSIGARNNAKIIVDRGRPSHGSRDCEGGVSVDVAAIPSNPAPPSRLGWHLTLFSAGLLYTFADLVFNLEIPLLGVAIVVLLGRELMRRDVGRVS